MGSGISANALRLAGKEEGGVVVGVEQGRRKRQDDDPQAPGPDLDIERVSAQGSWEEETASGWSPDGSAQW